MRSISIVMTYYNRPTQLALTLKSIEKSVLKDFVKIIIVDDVSDIKLKAATVIAESGLNINLIEISKEEKIWKGSGIAYNRGFRKASGDIVIIQNAECLHICDLLSHAVEHVQDDNYLSYSCLSISYKITEQIKTVWDTNFQEVLNILKKVQLEHPKLSDWVGWYCHNLYRPSAYHWLSAITKKNLNKLGGFDERYAQGYAYDDNDLLLRIKVMGLKVQIVSEEIGFAVHQQHEKVIGNPKVRVKVNRVNCKLFFKLKAEYEKKYGKTFDGCH